MTDSSGDRRWRFLPRTIRGLALGFAAASALVTAGLGLVTFALVHREIERQIDQRIAIETRALVNYERQYGFAALVRTVQARDDQPGPGEIGYLSKADLHDNAMGYLVLDARGKKVAGLWQARVPQPGWSEFVHFVRPDGSRGVAQAMNSGLSGGRLVIMGDRETVHRMDRLVSRLFGAGFGTLLLLGWVASIAFGRIVRHRVAAIEISSQAIIAGDTTLRLPRDGTGIELDRIAMVVNQMLDRISMLLGNLRDVSNNLAHDLRTPLSRLRLKLEQAEPLATEPVQQALLDDAIAESDQLLQLFSSLLAIAEIDGQRMRNRFVPLDLGDALTEIAEAYRASLEDSGWHLTVHAETVVVLGDKPLLQRLVGSLLDNVLRHTPPGTTAALTVVRDGTKARIRLVDDGPGVPDHERERIFQRLVRLDASRSTPGHGLGLSLVASIAAVHGGEVNVVPSERGLAIEVEIPLAT
ncbi:MAG TPA: ATP-binding protein [Sphingobium sp.]